MRTIQGPSLHLAQFSADQPPFNDLPSIAAWAASQGFKALQIPAWTNACSTWNRPRTASSTAMT